MIIDGIPKQLNHISKDIQEEFFRIVCAPVPDYPYTSYSKDAVEYIKKFSLKQQHGIKYILKNNGGVLSVIDKNLQTFYLQQFKKEKNVETLDNNDYMYICSELASNINVNIEMSILIIMLKKSNELNNIYNKLYTTKELYKSCSRICFGCNNPLCRNHDCPLSYERRKRNGKPDGTSIKKTDCRHFALWPYCVLETFFKKICQ